MHSSPPVMLVTGGSRGIGAATARLAAERGYAVALTYRQRVDEAEALVDELAEMGAQAAAFELDVGDEAAVERVFEQVDSRLGRLQVLVNNAGTLEPQMRVEAMDAERWRRVLNVNVVGSFLCAREAVLRMSTRRGGTGGAIVNVSSAAARLGAPQEYVDYAAAKAAVDTFTLGLSKEVAAEGIRVNAVRPGLILTEIHARGGEPNRVERLKGAVPMQRGGRPEEVAEAILWLASPAASYITGTLLDVTGGR